MTNGNRTSRVVTAEEEDSWRGGEPALDGLPGHKAQGLDRWEGSRRPGDHQGSLGRAGHLPGLPGLCLLLGD